MKNLSITLFCLIILSASVFAQQTPVAQVNWKEKVIGKWKYLGVEQFGVVDSVGAAQKKDMIEINADGSYSRIEDGKSSKGTYTIVAQGISSITFKDAATGKPKMYYLKKSTADKLIIEYQTPDLIRTRYQFGKMQ